MLRVHLGSSRVYAKRRPNGNQPLDHATTGKSPPLPRRHPRIKTINHPQIPLDFAADFAEIGASRQQILSAVAPCTLLACRRRFQLLVRTDLISVNTLLFCAESKPERRARFLLLHLGTRLSST